MSSPKVSAPSAEGDDDLDADAILAELEADDDAGLSSLRQQRLQEQMQQNLNSKPSGAMHVSSAGAKQDVTYKTLKSDDEALQFTTEHEKAILHFFHPDFARCSVMDEHLTRIAQRHDDFGKDEADVKFARVDVNHAAFVVQKLGIRVLPCVIGFVKGTIKGRVVGFEGLCWDGREKDVKVLRAVEERMVDWGVLRKVLIGKEEDQDDDSDVENKVDRARGRRGITGRKQQVEDEDDDWD